MTPAGPLVAQCLGPGSVLPRPSDHVLDLILVCDLLLLQVGHMDLRPLGVAHLDLVLETVLVDEEVSDLFVVDLKE